MKAISLSLLELSPNNLSIDVHGNMECQNVGTLAATETRTARAGVPRERKYGNILMVLVHSALKLQRKAPEDYAKFYNHGEGRY